MSDERKEDYICMNCKLEPPYCSCEKEYIKVTDCCGANYDEDIGRCPDCGELCGYVLLEEDE